MANCYFVTDTMDVSKGEQFDVIAQLADDDGNAIQLGGVTVTIDGTNRTALASAACTVANEEQGLVKIALTETITEALRYGRVNWLTLKFVWGLFDGRPNRISDKLWINAK